MYTGPPVMSASSVSSETCFMGMFGCDSRAWEMLYSGTEDEWIIRGDRSPGLARIGPLELSSILLSAIFGFFSSVSSKSLATLMSGRELDSLDDRLFIPELMSSGLRWLDGAAPLTAGE